MPEFDPRQIKQIPVDRRWALACYLPMVNIATCLIASVRAVDDDFVLFHARQGLVLFALWFLNTFVALISPILSLMVLGVIVALYIAGIVTAWGGSTVKFPVVGQIAMKIPKYYVFTTLTGKIPQNPDNGTGTEPAEDNQNNQLTK